MTITAVSAFICSAVEDKLKMFDLLPAPTIDYAKAPPQRPPRKKRSKRGAK